MTRYKALAVTTKYWMPSENYTQEIEKNLKGKIADEDFVVISEKAISTASYNIVDESRVRPGSVARLIAGCWMRLVWGYFLGFSCHFSKKLLLRLRKYPLESGSRHKQVALQQAGLFQALMFGSEGGIDGSNLAYSYVSLPLKNADKIAEKVREHLELTLGKRVRVLIVDTDKTYSFMNFHFTPRPKPIKGIHSRGGVVAYVVGRVLRLRRRATPVAVAGWCAPVEEALEVAELANHVRGFGAGRTVWDMADRFHVGLASVSWKMLEAVKHKPVVIVRRKR